MSRWGSMMPQEWHEYVNKEVKVIMCDKQEYEGWVYTVDPVSTSLVLVSFQQQGGANVRVVLGHAVREVQRLRDGDEAIKKQMTSLFSPAGSQTFSLEEIDQRRESLRAWLEKNLIPVTVEGDVLHVANALTISAPYGVEQCSSSNEIILARVQSLVENKPVSENQQ